MQHVINKNEPVTVSKHICLMPSVLMNSIFICGAPMCYDAWQTVRTFSFVTLEAGQWGSHSVDLLLVRLVVTPICCTLCDSIHGHHPRHWVVKGSVPALNCFNDTHLSASAISSSLIYMFDVDGEPLLTSSMTPDHLQSHNTNWTLVGQISHLHHTWPQCLLMCMALVFDTHMNLITLCTSSLVRLFNRITSFQLTLHCH
jgi:hypothetical protein